MAQFLILSISKKAIFMKNFKILFLFSLLCSNCIHQTKKVEDSNIKEIDINKNLSNTQEINLSAIASSIEYCVLETDEKCLVTPAMSVYCTEEYVVTIGGNQGHAGCYVFERKTGKFVRQISNYGRGPEEYTEIVSFWDGVNEQICVFGNNQFLFFNMDGTLSHKTNRFKHWMWHFVAYEDFYVGYTPNRFGDNTIRIAFYDKTGAFIDSIPNYRTWKRTQTWFSGGGDSWLYVFNNAVYFKEIYSDTLYHIKDFALYPRYVFNTGGRAVPYEIQEGGRYDVIGSLRKKGKVDDRYEKYLIILKIFENNKHLYFTIEYREQLYPAIYDKTEDRLQIISPISIPPIGRDWKIPLYGFTNDLDGGLPFWPQQMISDKEMMRVYTAEELLELDVSKITDPKLKNLLNSIDIESNPVVAIITLNH